MKLHFKNLRDLVHYRNFYFRTTPYFMYGAERDNLTWRLHNHRFANNKVMTDSISSEDLMHLGRNNFWKSRSRVSDKIARASTQ